MYYVWDTDNDETYSNTPADMARVAHMAHRFVDDADVRQNVLAMLFAPIGGAA
ncbi:MAG: hypothetical protein ABWY20_02410 [Mycobacterium sp.]